jgi:hypothetical protein
MKDLTAINTYRMKTPEVLEQFGSYGDGSCGAFLVPYPRTGVTLKCVASSGMGWDHVSVSLMNRCPNWFEMEFIKRMFFKADEVAMQLHVGEKDHISIHPYVLHIWRPHLGMIPLPPKEFV